MEHESQAEQGGVERKMAVAQLLQIKYILAGILALILFGRDKDWEVNLITIAVTFWFVYSVETFCAWISGSASRLASILRRRKAATAESERRMRQLLKDLEQAEEQALRE
jgi:hypothetical protein